MLTKRPESRIKAAADWRLGEIPASLTWEPFRINLDLSFGINFTSEFWPTIKNQALEFDQYQAIFA